MLYESRTYHQTLDAQLQSLPLPLVQVQPEPGPKTSQRLMPESAELDTVSNVVDPARPVPERTGGT